MNWRLTRLLCVLLLVTARARLARGQDRSSIHALEKRADSLAERSDSASLREAARLWLTAAGSWRHAGQQQRAAAAFVNAGMAAMGRGDAIGARMAYRQALALQRQFGALASQETTYTRLGLTYRQSAASDSAIANYLAALAISDRARGVDSLRAAVLNDLGYEYVTIGRYDLAFRTLHDAEQRARTLGDSAIRSDALNNLGLVFDEMGMAARSEADLRALDSALTYYESARKAAPAGTGQRNDPTTLNNIGVIHRRRFHLTGDTAELRTASAYYDSASSGADSSDARFAALLLQNKGLVAADRGEARADSLLAASRVASHEAGDLWWEAMALAERGWLYRRSSKDLARATAYLDTAVALFSQVQHRAGGDATRVSFADQRYLLDVYDSWALTRIARATKELQGAEREAALFAVLAAMERGRAAALVELVQHVHAGEGEQLESASRAIPTERDLEREGRSLAAAAQRSARMVMSFASTADTLITWRATRGRDPTVTAVPVRRDTLAARVAHLRRLLRVELDETADTVSSATVVAFRLPRLEEGTTRSVGGGDDVAPGDTLFGDTLRAFAQSLFTPEDVRALSETDEILIVPNGPLALVPFSTLLAGHWGLRSDSAFSPGIRLIPSLRLIATDASRERPSTRGAVLVVGNPSMPTVRDFRGEAQRLPAIRAAGREADSIASLFHVRALHGGDATEDSIRKLLPKASVVHLATHGYAYGDDARAGDSFVALAPGRGEDGLLTVREVASLRPLRAELVVLSACETALGALKQAEGTVGLQRAFLGRGAQTVLVSLWSVSDAATAKLMMRFYEHWRTDGDRPSKAQALARAQADVRTDPQHPLWKHPRYWAAFQLVGAK